MRNAASQWMDYQFSQGCPFQLCKIVLTILYKHTLGFDKQVSLCNNVFAEFFHRVVGLCSSFFDEINLSKTTSTNDFYQVKVFKADFLCWLKKVLAVAILIFVLF